MRAAGALNQWQGVNRTRDVHRLSEALSVQVGRCFRFIDQASAGHAQRCPAEVAVRGAFNAGDGKIYAVEICAWHSQNMRTCPIKTI
jgi:hypothetical protein